MAFNFASGNEHGSPSYNDPVDSRCVAIGRIHVNIIAFRHTDKGLQTLGTRVCDRFSSASNVCRI
jgi:hypothetical protein